MKETTLEKDEFNSVYKKRYGYIPFTLRDQYHPIPLKIQIPSTEPVYTTEHIYLPAYWDNEKRMRFICHIYERFTRSRL